MARILMTEDDASLRKIYRLWLEAAGHGCVEAGDGFAALEALGQSGPFDLVLSDVMMPELDGELLALAFERAAPELPILVATAVRDEKILRALQRQPNVREILNKPVRREVLLKGVARILSPGAPPSE